MEYEIKPKGTLNLGLKELWDFRELFYMFAWRDIKVKYKQAVFGIGWAILQPLFLTLIFVYFLGNYINSTPTGLPYPIFVLSGFVLWTLFSNALSTSANSMVANAHIIKKVYFPRLVIPIAAVLSAFVDMLFSLLVFIGACIYYKTSVNMMSLVYWCGALLITAVAAMGFGTFLSALNVKYRDFRFIIPFFIQVLLFVSPVIYPVKQLNNPILEQLLILNPMSGALELFRAGITGYSPNYNIISSAAICSLVYFIIGLAVFRKTESYFADIA